MIRVRICTSRCRCHSSCRTSRFSGLGTHTRGKLFSSNSFNRSWASWRSVFCLRTRLGLTFAASPIHTYNEHVRLLPPEHGSSTTTVYLGRGSRHCYEIKWIAPRALVRESDLPG